MRFEIDSLDFPEAQCATIEDKDFFFPKTGKQEAERLPQLRALCARCIHEKECLEYATEKQIEFGFWGGRSATERQKARQPYIRGFAKNGKAKKIKGLSESGKSAQEISSLTGIRKHYVHRILTALKGGAYKGATPLHRQTKNLSNDLQPSSEQAS